jgi:hypothetical protein
MDPNHSRYLQGGFGHCEGPGELKIIHDKVLVTDTCTSASLLRRRVRGVQAGTFNVNEQRECIASEYAIPQDRDKLFLVKPAFHLGIVTTWYELLECTIRRGRDDLVVVDQHYDIVWYGSNDLVKQSREGIASDVTTPTF